MKYTLLLSLLLSCTLCLSQDPELFEDDWYLHELVVDGESYDPIVNDDVGTIDLIFFKGGFYTIVCNSIDCLYSSINNEQFTITNFVYLEGACFEQETFDFQELYLEDFFTWQIPDTTFFYEISEDGEDRT